ncbi:MAG: type IV pilin protein [Steroidobacteraceae bacterium]
MKKNGFTLVELMIAVGISAILTAIAVPTYLGYTKRANRIDATRALTLNAQALERCYSQSFNYAGCAAAPAGTTVSSQGFYTVTVVVATTPTATYTVTATPRAAPQLSDSSCQSFSINNAGTQSAVDGSNNNTTKTCWGSI